MPATEGECGNQQAGAQRMGVGVKDEVNALEPNNQHVDVFTGWPSSVGAAGQGRSLGLRVLWELWAATHSTILLDDGRAVLAAKNNRMESFHEVSKYVLHLILNPTTCGK